MVPVLALLVAVNTAGPAAPREPPALEIAADTTLDPAKTYGRLVITASGVTVDGNGAKIIGSAGEPKSFRGVGVTARGVSNVTLKNLTVRGFETGLWVEDGRGWTVEHCDFSGNFDDPAFGWGQLSRRGGIVFVGVSASAVRHCRANRNWAGCVLERSSDNRLEGNDFSHASEACLELWQAAGNTILKNKLDYGNRARGDEVHARDSTCVLIESGSDRNTFADNSCTHGGDGIFVRALNGWVSTGNRFLRNDCSYAHNHGFECWCPGNVFDGNIANHCSYGFWLGGSDRTVLVNNEASFNGDPNGNHFAPHLPNKGHAGIVFMRGSGAHIIARGNRCVGNNGAGIALIGDEPSKGVKWKAHHWVIEGNTLTGNRWGLYGRYADWIDVAGNTIADNTAAGIDFDSTVTNVTEHAADMPNIAPPAVTVAGPAVARVGQRVVFDASRTTDPTGRPLTFRWRFGDRATADSARVEHTFAAPGFYRVGVTTTNGPRTDLGSWDVFVVSDRPEVGTEGQVDRWDADDPMSTVRFAADEKVRLVGRSSVRADVGPYGGGRVGVRCSLTPGETGDLAGKSRLEVWFRAENPNIPCWQGENPIVTVSGPDGSRTLRPKVEVIDWTDHPESREGWLLIRVPLAGDATWIADGKLPRRIERMALAFDSWGSRPFRVWLDGLRFE